MLFLWRGTGVQRRHLRGRSSIHRCGFSALSRVAASPSRRRVPGLDDLSETAGDRVRPPKITLPACCSLEEVGETG